MPGDQPFAGRLRRRPSPRTAPAPSPRDRAAARGSRVREPGAARSQSLDLRSSKPCQTWPICCRYSVALVRHACRRRSTRRRGLSTRAHLGSIARPVGDEVQRRERASPRRAPASSIGSSSSVPSRSSTFAVAVEALARGGQHRARLVDGDHPADVRRQRSLSWPVPQPRSPTVQRSSSSPSSAPQVGATGRTARRAARSHCAVRRREEALRSARRRRARARSRDDACRARRRARRAPPARARRARAASRRRVETGRAPSSRVGSSPRRARRPTPRRLSVFRCRLTVDCGSCSTAHSSPTVSSCRSSRSSIRLRVGSASALRRSRMEVDNAVGLEGDSGQASEYPDERSNTTSYMSSSKAISRAPASGDAWTRSAASDGSTTVAPVSEDAGYVPAMPIVRIPAARAASIPAGASSTTTHVSGAKPSARAAAR